MRVCLRCGDEAVLGALDLVEIIIILCSVRIEGRESILNGKYITGIERRHIAHASTSNPLVVYRINLRDLLPEIQSHRGRRRLMIDPRLGEHQSGGTGLRLLGS